MLKGDDFVPSTVSDEDGTFNLPHSINVGKDITHYRAAEEIWNDNAIDGSEGRVKDQACNRTTVGSLFCRQIARWTTTKRSTVQDNVFGRDISLDGKVVEHAFDVLVATGLAWGT